MIQMTNNQIYAMKARAHSSEDLQRGVMREVALCYLIENYVCEYFEKYNNTPIVSSYLLQAKLHMAKIVKNTLRTAKDNVLDSYSYVAGMIDEYVMEDITKLQFAYNREYMNLNLSELHAEMMILNYLFDLVDKTINENIKMTSEMLGKPVTYTDSLNLGQARSKIRAIIHTNHIVEMHSSHISLAKQIIKNKIYSNNLLDKLNQSCQH